MWYAYTLIKVVVSSGMGMLRTPLHVAVREGKKDIIQYLVEECNCEFGKVISELLMILYVNLLETVSHNSSNPTSLWVLSISGLQTHLKCRLAADKS